MQQNLNEKYIKFLSDDEGKSKILASELNVPQAEFDAVWSWFLLLLQSRNYNFVVEMNLKHLLTL